MSTVDTEQTKQDTILIVSKDDNECERLIDLFENVGGYHTLRGATFEEGLASILIQPLSLIIIQVRLPDLSGIDLLAAVNTLCPNLPAILIDDNLSAKSAVAAFRLGAIDYVCQPVNYDFLLMRVEGLLRSQVVPQPPPPEPVPQPAKYSPKDRERRLNPETRSMGLMVKRSQFLLIARELQALQTHTKAIFVGLVDSDENLIGAAGTLEDWDLMLFRKALTNDARSSQQLLDVLGETAFHSTFFEGKNNSVYVTQFGQPHPVSLIVICPVHIKPGVAWFYSKQVAKAIDGILQDDTK